MDDETPGTAVSPDIDTVMLDGTTSHPPASMPTPKVNLSTGSVLHESGVKIAAGSGVYPVVHTNFVMDRRVLGARWFWAG